MRHFPSKEELLSYLKENNPKGKGSMMASAEDITVYRNECFELVKVGHDINMSMLKKIPAEFLLNILEIFRKRLPNEALCRVYWDGEKYILDEPEVYRVSPCYINTAPAEIEKGLLVFEIHSHDTMRPFFSATDDRDEIYPGIYGVMGLVDRQKPAVKFRVVLDGDKAAVNSDKLFE